MVMPSATASTLLRIPPALTGEMVSPSSSPVWMTCAVMFSAASAGRSRWVTLQPAAKAAASDSVMASAIHGQSSPVLIFVGRCYAADRAWPAHLSPVAMESGCRNGSGHAGPCLAPKSPSQAARAALSCRPTNGGTHEETVGRLAGALLALVLTIRFCRSAKQGHRRDRGRLLPVLSADGAGQAARRIRKGGPGRRTGRPQGRLGRAEGRARRQRRRGVRLFRPLRQSGRQEAGAAVLRGL